MRNPYFRTDAEVRHLRPKSMYEFWREDPVSALELAFIEAQERGLGEQTHPRIHVSLGYMDRSHTRYGSFGYLGRDHLEGRRFIVDFWDGRLGVEFVDVWFCPFHPDGHYLGKKLPRMPYEIPEVGSLIKTPQGLLPVITFNKEEE